MNIKLDGQTVAQVITALVEHGAAMGLDVRMPDGIDIEITNEVISGISDGRNAYSHTAPTRIAIRWHYADGDRR